MTFQRISLGLMILGAVAVGVPMPAQAATPSVPTYTQLQDLTSHTTRTSRTSSRGERYSSAITREIRKLDSDPVQDLKIPVLLGVSVRNLYPSFGDPRGGGTRLHEGLDIMAPMGAFIASPTDAVVTGTGNGESSGITVTTANPGGERFVYMHLSGIADGVRSGTVLKEGDLIGYVGDTGNAKGGAPHLHFEIRDGRTATDPFPRLTKEFTAQERIAVLTELLKDLQAELAKRKD